MLGKKRAGAKQRSKLSPRRKFSWNLIHTYYRRVWCSKNFGSVTGRTTPWQVLLTYAYTSYQDPEDERESHWIYLLLFPMWPQWINLLFCPFDWPNGDGQKPPLLRLPEQAFYSNCSSNERRKESLFQFSLTRNPFSIFIPKLMLN